LPVVSYLILSNNYKTTSKTDYQNFKPDPTTNARSALPKMKDGFYIPLLEADKKLVHDQSSEGANAEIPRGLADAFTARWGGDMPLEYLYPLLGPRKELVENSAEWI